MLKKLILSRFRWLVLIVVSLVIGISGFLSFRQWTRDYNAYPGGIDASGITLFGDQNQYVFLESESYVGAFVLHNYVVDISGKLLSEKDGKKTNTIQEGEYIKATRYDLRTEGFQEKTIDFYQMDFGEAYKGYFLRAPSSVDSGYYYKDTDYLLLVLTPTGQESDLPEKEVLFNLETEKVEEITEDFRTFQANLEAENYELSQTEGAVYLSDQLNHVRLLFSAYSLSTVAAGPPTNLLETNFNTLYPEIAQKMNNTEKNDVGIYRRLGTMDNETWFNTVIHWLAPKGQANLDLVARTNNYDYETKKSYFTNETPVSSYAEIQAWRAKYPLDNTVSKED